MQMTAWIASALIFATFCMRSNLHMRAVAVLGNLAFIAYALLGLQDGIFDRVLPILVLHVSTLVLNVSRLIEMVAEKKHIALIVEDAESRLLRLGWLQPDRQTSWPDTDGTSPKLPMNARRQNFPNRRVLSSGELPCRPVTPTGGIHVTAP